MDAQTLHLDYQIHNLNLLAINPHSANLPIELRLIAKNPTNVGLHLLTHCIKTMLKINNINIVIHIMLYEYIQQKIVLGEVSIDFYCDQ